MNQRFLASSALQLCFLLCTFFTAIEKVHSQACPTGEVSGWHTVCYSNTSNYNDGTPHESTDKPPVSFCQFDGTGIPTSSTIDGYREHPTSPDSFQVVIQNFNNNGPTSQTFLNTGNTYRGCVPGQQCDKEPGEAAGYFNTSGADVCHEGCALTFSDWGLRVISGVGTNSMRHYVNTGGDCGDNSEVAAKVAPGQDCATSKDGKTVCLGDGGTPDKNCGLVNGQPVCTENTQCGTVNGEEVCIEDSGCGTVNGQTVCPDENPETDICLTTESGQRFCVDDDGSLDDPQNEQTQDDVIQETDDDGDPAGNGPFIFIMGGTGPDTDGDGQGDGAGGDGTGGGDGSCDPETEECGDGLTGSATSCDDVPSCSDADAILCAVLRQVHKSQCETFAPGDNFEQEARAAVGLPSSDSAAIDALYQGPSEIAEFAALVGINIPDAPGGACPAPLTFVAFGETREFPLDPICQFLGYLSVFVVFGSVFAGLRIAVKG
ncbi:virulence factor TspB C-terminal domain-related protein [Algiphilus sp.]|uniref:virulence factor TspB C-terminal domain-related protein n=1 Tax=Algiphilus sp. TaxID=1872431 RepID=UPI003BA9DE0A